MWPNRYFSSVYLQFSTERLHKSPKQTNNKMKGKEAEEQESTRGRRDFERGKKVSKGSTVCEKQLRCLLIRQWLKSSRTTLLTCLHLHAEATGQYQYKAPAQFSQRQLHASSLLKICMYMAESHFHEHLVVISRMEKQLLQEGVTQHCFRTWFCGHINTSQE